MEQEDFKELFINEAQFVDWENQIVDINVSYWNDYTGKIYEINLTVEDEDQFMTIGIIIKLLYKLPIIEDLRIEFKHITQLDTRDY